MSESTWGQAAETARTRIAALTAENAWLLRRVARLERDMHWIIGVTTWGAHLPMDSIFRSCRCYRCTAKRALGKRRRKP